MAWLDEWHGESEIQSEIREKLATIRLCFFSFFFFAPLTKPLPPAAIHPVKLNQIPHVLMHCVCVCVCANACMRSLLFPTGLSLEEVREYEQMMQEKTNSKLKCSQNSAGEVVASDLL